MRRGPHLHLQLQPATAWPQQEPWFEAFAGRAFNWSDAAVDPGETDSRTLSFARSAAPAPVSQPAPGPVFAVVQQPAAQTPDSGVVLFSRPAG